MANHAVTKTRRPRRLPKTPAPPLPVGAQVDPSLMEGLGALVAGFPGTVPQMLTLLAGAESRVSFEPAAQWLNALLRGRFDALPRMDDAAAHALYLYIERCGDEGLRSRVLRALLARPDRWIRRRVQGALARRPSLDVALPTTHPSPSRPPPTPTQTPWGWQGWLHERDEASSALTQHNGGIAQQQAVNVPVLESVSDLRALLGIPSTKALGWLLLACDGRALDPVAGDESTGPYRCFEIPKRDGGTRLICEPSPPLKRVQRRILDDILKPLAVHDAAHGFLEGRSILSNARPHAGHEVLVKFDLQDFFPSIHFWRVVGLFASLGYAVGKGHFRSADSAKAIAPVLARLVTFTRAPKVWGRGVLAQGAPTSPSISNLVCRGLDARLSGLAAKLGGVYTRYADDMTFSFAQLQNPGRLRWWVDQICQQEGFVLHPRKFRVIRRSQRQLVTGLVVNQTPALPREDRRRLRAILHNCKAHGVASQAKDDPGFMDRLRGEVSYLQMVHPEEGLRLREALDALSHQPTTP